MDQSNDLTVIIRVSVAVLVALTILFIIASILI